MKKIVINDDGQRFIDDGIGKLIPEDKWTAHDRLSIGLQKQAEQAPPEPKETELAGAPGRIATGLKGGIKRTGAEKIDLEMKVEGVKITKRAGRRGGSYITNRGEQPG